MKKVLTGSILIIASAGFAAAAVNVDVSTPNASIRIGTPQPAPQATVIERERVIVKEDDEHRDNGKHKGHYKGKKNKKKHHDDDEHEGHRKERGDK